MRICTSLSAYKQCVALTGRNATGPPCSRGAIIRLEAAWCYRLACVGETARRPDVECYRRRQTPATLLVWPPTLCVGGPVIKQLLVPCCLRKAQNDWLFTICLLGAIIMRSDTRCVQKVNASCFVQEPLRSSCLFVWVVTAKKLI